MKPVRCLFGRHNDFKHILKMELTGYNYVPIDKQWIDDESNMSMRVLEYQWVCTRCGRKTKIVTVNHV